MPAHHIENGRDIKMRQDNLVRARQQGRQGIETGAMRYRRCEQMGVALVEQIDVGVVAQAHEQQVAVGQYCTLRPAGRARGENSQARSVGAPGSGRNGWPAARSAP